MSSSDVFSVIDHFKLTSIPVKIEIFGEGHIHETYLVETIDHQPDYILQKINKNIFKDIPGMMSNIEAVTSHIQNGLSLVYTHAGISFYEDENGDFWRMFLFIPNTVSFQLITEPSLAYEAGKAIGSFQSDLTGLTDPLVETIPDFHNINLRINQYFDAKNSDPAHRLTAITSEIQFAEDHFGRMREFLNSLKEKAVLHVTHNDTKLNNILFDRNNKALCLIDLDTVMPGYVHFDYGDALRTMANTALEDEKDLSKVRFNKEVYNLFTEGYLETAGEMLSEAEKQLLPYSPVYLTFIIGLRFLTDYLNGDKYFRVHYPEHNIDRARVQFKLVREMEMALNFVT
jgi:serine/threonine protein kinase